MMKKLITSILFGFIGLTMMAQVGINVPGAPISILEIQGDDNSIPTLKLTPQTAPTGTETGQISVINDQLFMYDAPRAKWLSVESEMMMFGENSALAGDDTRFGGDLRATDTGAVMPLDGTIVFATGRLGSGDTDKVITVTVRNGTTDQDSDTIQFVPGPSANDAQFIRTDFNLDFSAGDYITVSIAAGDVIVEHVVLLWVKWRP